MQIPRDFVQLHKYVTLVADVMFVNGLPFLVTSSQGLSLVTIEHLPSRTATHLVQTLERVFKIYTTAKFIIQTTMMDKEFEKLRPLIFWENHKWTHTFDSSVQTKPKCFVYVVVTSVLVYVCRKS